MTQYGEQVVRRVPAVAGGRVRGGGVQPARIVGPRGGVAPGDPVAAGRGRARAPGWGGIDADDLLAVLDATLERWPALDPARVGVLGGSYGGFMTTWLLARTDRFAAGCSERAVNNLLSEEWSSATSTARSTASSASATSTSPRSTCGCRRSPTPATSRRPMLILHSEQDLRCHLEQADALFSPLRLLGTPTSSTGASPARATSCPAVGSPFHRVRRAELINAFFERTLGSGPK